MPKKAPPINYSSRDFETIRESLVEFSKRYYPETFKDFNEASFGMMMLDSVAYVGDVLSFYLDYQTNEAFLDSSVEYNNVVRHARQMGYRLNYAPTASGVQSFYILVPAVSMGYGPDLRYMPTLKAGSTVGGRGGVSYILTADVDFRKDGYEVVVGRVDEATGIPSFYAVKAKGRVVSGNVKRRRIPVGEFRKFPKVELGPENIAEIMSVTDTEGHEYFEVDNLSQDVIYKPVRNTNEDKHLVGSVLKPVSVARRFVVEREAGRTYLQFGHGNPLGFSGGSVVEPNDNILQMNGRDYISSTTFDPFKLVTSDKFGIAPSNTVLVVEYRANDVDNTNSSQSTVTEVTRPIMKFEQSLDLAPGLMNIVSSSLETNNEEPILGEVTIPSSEEIKIRARGYYASQSRAVTAQDYKSLVYAMPLEYGSAKRVAVVQDSGSFKRNLNLYLVSEDVEGNLIEAPATLKKNVKTWLQTHKMINDSIDIMNAKIVNFGVDFKIVTSLDSNRYEVLQNCSVKIRDEFELHFDIGEPLVVSKLYKILNDVPGVEDTIEVKIVPKNGGNYSSTTFRFAKRMTPDGRLIRAYDNTIFELKFPGDDIRGSVQ